MKIKQIHDKFFRSTFANLEVSQNFLKELTQGDGSSVFAC
jgi:hypothetical protein